MSTKDLCQGCPSRITSENILWWSQNLLLKDIPYGSPLRIPIMISSKDKRNQWNLMEFHRYSINPMKPMFHSVIEGIKLVRICADAFRKVKVAWHQFQLMGSEPFWVIKITSFWFQKFLECEFLQKMIGSTTFLWKSGAAESGVLGVQLHTHYLLLPLIKTIHFPKNFINPIIRRALLS